MFDDQSSANQNNQSNSNSLRQDSKVIKKQNLVKPLSPKQSIDQIVQSAEQTNPPPNLPVGAISKNSDFRAPDDIFADVDKGEDNADNFLNQKQEKLINQQQAPKNIIVPQPPLSIDKQKLFLRKIFIFILAAIILSLLIVSGIFIYKIFKASNALPEENDYQESINDNLLPYEKDNLINPDLENMPEEPFLNQEQEREVEPEAESEPKESETNPEPEPIFVLDTDMDKIPDEEEIKIGTNPRAQDTDFDKLSDYEEVYIYKTNPINKDTDNDQLSDYEEIFIYQTNPFKIDTDGDSYSDSIEVQNGYNPKGDGKL